MTKLEVGTLVVSLVGVEFTYPWCAWVPMGVLVNLPSTRPVGGVHARLNAAYLFCFVPYALFARSSALPYGPNQISSPSRFLAAARLLLGVPGSRRRLGAMACLRPAEAWARVRAAVCGNWKTALKSWRLFALVLKCSGRPPRAM